LQLSDYTKIYNADIGSCYLMLERYAEVEAPYLEAIIYYKGLMSDPYSRGMAVDRVTGYQTMLAHSYAKLKKYRKALALYKKTLKLCEKEGLLANQELCLAGYGLAYGLSNQPEKALPLFVEGYRLAVLNGSADRIKSQFYLTCSWMWSAKGEAEALKFYTKEYDFVHGKTGMDKSLKAIGPGLTGSLK
jgi:tetratricopeptide (TPR) repeat protein